VDIPGGSSGRKLAQRAALVTSEHLDHFGNKQLAFLFGLEFNVCFCQLGIHLTQRRFSELLQATFTCTWRQWRSFDNESQYTVWFTCRVMRSSTAVMRVLVTPAIPKELGKKIVLKQGDTAIGSDKQLVFLLRFSVDGKFHR
jgi:hypothetical protein